MTGPSAPRTGFVGEPGKTLSTAPAFTSRAALDYRCSSFLHARDTCTLLESDGCTTSAPLTRRDGVVHAGLGCQQELLEAGLEQFAQSRLGILNLPCASARLPHETRYTTRFSFCNSCLSVDAPATQIFQNPPFTP